MRWIRKGKHQSRTDLRISWWEEVRWQLRSVPEPILPILIPFTGGGIVILLLVLSESRPTLRLLAALAAPIVLVGASVLVYLIYNSGVGDGGWQREMRDYGYGPDSEDEGE